MTTNFKILACFTRSFDEHHDNNNIHLIASTVLVRDNFNYQPLFNSLDSPNGGKKYYVVDIYDNGIFNPTPSLDFIKLIESPNRTVNYNRYTDVEKYGYLSINLNDLFRIDRDNDIDAHTDEDKTKYFIRDIFYKCIDTKSENQIYTQTLFVFNNITWSNIVLKFKIHNIDVSGGGTTKRHILSSTDILLSTFLNKIFQYDHDFILNLGYKTYKDEKEVMSSRIPLNTYKAYLDNFPEIKKLNSHSNSIFNEIKLIIESKRSSDDALVNDVLVRILANNLLISRNLIVRQLILHTKTELMDSIGTRYYRRRSELYTLEEQFDKFDTSTKYMSVKSKKKLKKERTELIKTGIDPDDTYIKITKMRVEVSNLEKAYNLKIRELSNKLKDINKLNFEELFKKYDKFNQKEYLSTRTIFNKYQTFTKPFYQMRRYSTSVNRNS